MTQEHQQVDSLVRERINRELDQTLFVEASAGTGKTAALVSRYVALVLAGHEVDRIVAITFTEKAAAELRDRVRQGLELHRVNAEPPVLARIDAAMGALDRAEISTIHAFCQRLLRSFAVRAGIDPAFEIDDAVAAERRFEQRWRAYLQALGEDAQAVEAMGRLLDLGLTTRNLQDLAHNLWEHTEVAFRLAERPLTAPQAHLPNFEELISRLEGIDRSHVPDDDRLSQRIDDTLKQVREILAAPPGDRSAYLAGLASDLSPNTGNTGNRNNWRGSADLDEARETTGSCIVSLLDSLDALRSDALATALPLFVRFVTDESKARYAEGRLVFDDLILGVREVLRTDPGAREELRRRFDTILVDEFQDTDPLQVEIAMAFATATSSDNPEPGRLFLVGDPKQSIYRFRRADMAIYAATAEKIVASGGQAIELSLNRRSRPGVIDWVNAVFAHVFGGRPFADVQPPYRPLNAYRENGVHGPAVAWFGDSTDVNAADLRHIEAQHLAAYSRLVVEQGWEVAERDETIRPARYGDIALLLPSRSILPSLERALASEGIPFRVESGSLIYATQEIRDILNCLTAIDDPTDDIAIVAALRSPAYACTDVEIARFRLGGGSFNYLAPLAAEGTGQVGDALRDLRYWHEHRAEFSLAALVEAYVAERRLVEIGLVDARNRNALRRARFLVQQAREFEAAGPESLRSFLEWLERRASNAIMDIEGASLDDDEDALRILTIHSSKGLEFPIVFMAGLGTAPPNVQFVIGQDRRDDSVAIVIGASGRNAQFRLGPTEDVRRNETEHQEAERERLLYVAATRARDHLVVSLFHTSKTTRCAAMRLAEAGAQEHAEAMPPVALARPTNSDPFAGLEVEPGEVDEATFVIEREALVANAVKQRHTSATALGRSDEVKDDRVDETEPWSRGRAGTHLGRAVHAALQTIALDADNEAIRAIATAQTVAEAVPHLGEEAMTLIRTALQSEPAVRARTSRRALREVPFALPHGDTLLEGYVDLLIEADDGSLEVVDWKTDHVPPSEVEARLRDYELQAGIYVLGIEQATGRSVSRVSYVFVSAEGRTASPGDPAILRSQALSKLEASATKP